MNLDPVNFWVRLQMEKIFHGNKTNAPGMNLKILVSTSVQLKIFQYVSIFAELNIWIIYFAVILMKTHLKELNKSDGYYH